MGQTIIHVWYCDRCKVEMKEKPKVERPLAKMRLEVEDEFSVEIHGWTDVCPSCNSEMLDIINRLVGERP